MRAVGPFFIACVLVACTPPPKVAGYSQAAPAPARTAPSAQAETPPPPPPPLVPEPRTPGIAPLLTSHALTAEDVLGEPGGFALEAASPSGSYFAYCQPKGTSSQKPLDQGLDQRLIAQGPLQLTLAVGTERFLIDEFLAGAPDGSYVMTLEAGRPVLRDTVKHKSFSLAELGVDLERDAWAEHRSVAFSLDSRELALITRSTTTLAELRILDLLASDPTTAVRVVPLEAAFFAPVGRTGTLHPWRVFAESEAFVVASVWTESKESHWPVRAATEPTFRCRHGSLPAFSRTSGPLRDPTVRHALLLRGKSTLAPAPGFVMAVPGGWVRREDDGRLLVVRGKQQQQLASARCGGRILGTDRSGWFLVSCEEYRPVRREEPKSKSSKRRPSPPQVRFPLYLLKPGVVRDLDVESMRWGVDVPPQGEGRYVAVRAESGLLLVDLALGRVEMLKPADRVLLGSGDEVILSSGGRLVRWADGQRLELGPLRSLDPLQLGQGSTPTSLAIGQVVYSRPPSAPIPGGSDHLGSAEGSWVAQTLTRAPLAVGHTFALVPEAEATPARWARAPVHVVPLRAAPAGVEP